MKLCFTTLGCPDWSWAKIIEEAPRMGYDGLELRGVEGEMHLPKARPFLPENIDATMAELKRAGLEIACLGASAHFHGKVAENIAAAKEHIDLAAKLQAPYVRVFGDKIPNPAEREKTVAQVAAALQELGDYAAGTGVKVIIESHGDFSRTDDLLDVLSRVSSPHVGVLWDVHHPYRFFGEAVADTYRRLRDRIFHLHLKDSRPTPNGCQYCLPGAGDVPLKEVVDLLRADGYDGWLSFEWEKKWHPEIEDPEVALPAYARYMRALLG